MMPWMRIVIPADLPTDPPEAYRRGWHDGIAAIGRKGGSQSSDAKAEAARLNGRKGGRPRNGEAKPARPRRGAARPAGKGKVRP
jgi:hypothetical protein